MLLPVYVLGFIFGGLVLFAVASGVRNRKAKIALRTIAVIAGPLFFLVMGIFSGWERERTYDVEWLTGGPAAEYLGDRNPDVTNPITSKREKLVVLRRRIGDQYDCYQTFASDELAHYLEAQKTHNVVVRYRVTYDFYVLRGYSIEAIGDFGRDPATRREISVGMLGRYRQNCAFKRHGVLLPLVKHATGPDSLKGWVIMLLLGFVHRCCSIAISRTKEASGGSFVFSAIRNQTRFLSACPLIWSLNPMAGSSRVNSLRALSHVLDQSHRSGHCFHLYPVAQVVSD